LKEGRGEGRGGDFPYLFLIKKGGEERRNTEGKKGVSEGGGRITPNPNGEGGGGGEKKKKTSRSSS